MKSNEESLLIDKAKQGDQQAYGKLVQKYYKKVFFVTKRYLSQENAEDATQRTFMEAWKYIHTFKGNSSIYTWLVRIAINTCKKSWLFDKQHTHENIDDHKIPVYDNTAENIDTEIHDQALKKALETLTERQQLILHLRIHDNLSFIQIGEALGCAETTAKSHYHHVKKLLVKLLGGKYGKR